MARLENDFRCFAVERPSHGASGQFDYLDRAGDRRHHVTMVIGDLLDGIGVDRAPIVGNSLGGLRRRSSRRAHLAPHDPPPATIN